MTRAWIFLVALALMWGTSFAAMSKALAGLDPLAIMGFRLAIGAVLLVCIAAVMQTGRPMLSAWWQYGGIAVLGNCVPFSLIAWGQLSVSSAVAGTVMGTMPMVTAALAMGLGIERLTRGQWLGLLVGFVGLCMLSLGQARLAGDLSGIAAIVTAVLCYALSTLIARKGPDKNALRAGAATLSVAGVVGLTIWGIWGQDVGNAQPVHWGYVLYLAMFPTALAVVLYFAVVRIAGPVFLSQVNYMVPVIAFLIGATLMREPIFTELPLAIALILAGLYLASRVVRR